MHLCIMMNTNIRFDKTEVMQIADQNKSKLGEEVYSVSVCRG